MMGGQQREGDIMTDDDIRKASENRMLFDGRMYVRRMSRFPTHVRLILMAEYEALIAPAKDSTDAFLEKRFEAVQ